jgi:hypothetical protein
MKAALEQPVGLEARGSVRPPSTGSPSGTTLRSYLRWVLAIAALASGAIHFGVAGEHYAVSWSHGAFMAVVGWCQLVWAAAVLVRPSRRVLIIGVLGNAAIIGVWVMATVWGVPVGPGAWTPQQIGWQDGIATVCEAAIVAIGLSMVSAPHAVDRRMSGRVGWPIVIGLGAIVGMLSSFAFTPSWASGGHSRTAVAGHEHPQVLGAVTTPCQQALPDLPSGAAASGHGHRGPIQEVPITNPAVRDQLAAQLTQARAAAAALPTVADALTAGYIHVSDFLPCVGAHYAKVPAFDSTLDPRVPEFVLYDGTAPNSRIVGLSYAMTVTGEAAPEGFAGPNDPWHRHKTLCFAGDGTGIVGGEDVSKAECDDLHGGFINAGNIWMSHEWVVPGWESPWGTFSAENPNLGGRIGDINGAPDPNRKTLGGRLD